MRQIPTVYKVIFSILGVIFALGGVATYSTGIDFPVFAFGAVGVLLLVAAVTNRVSWILPLYIVVYADEVGALVTSPIAPFFESSLGVSLLAVGLETWLLVAWIKWEKSTREAPPVVPDAAA